VAVALLSGAFCLIAPVAQAQQVLPNDDECRELKTNDKVLKGWCVGINNRKGNCLACHHVVTKEKWPAAVAPGGNVAPPLLAMKARFPDRAKLRDQIWDATQSDPFSMMPPFGKHKLVSEEELDNIVEWLYTL
jgi:sulfur-oxidizing protein SoxX